MTEVTRGQFDAIFAEFLPALQAWQDEYYKKHYKLEAPKFSAEPGKKYIRIVETRGCGANVTQRSVYCFLDFQGNIYKAASWKKPAKHLRGSIFDKNFSFGKALTTYGAVYLR